MKFKELENEYEEYEFKEVDITGYENNLVTADRLIVHECIIGESIHDDFEGLMSCFWEALFVGHLMTKRTDLVEDILSVINEVFRDYIPLSDIEDLFDNGDDTYPARDFFGHYADFINLTPKTRARINKHLINISVGCGEEPNL